MKLLAVAVLTLATAACTAEKAPVVIATDIYTSCLTGFTQAYGIPNTKKDVEQQTTDLDRTCVAWAHTWLPGFLNREQGGLTVAENFNFLQQRKQIIAQYREELLEMTPEK